MSNDLIEKLKQTVIDGDESASKKTVEECLNKGFTPVTILNEGLMAGAVIVGDKFETGEFFLPQLMFTGRALKSGMTVLDPLLKEGELGGEKNPETGVVFIATVKTDIHDIGKI